MTTHARTNIPSICAVGDVTNRMNLTPVTLMEGTCFACIACRKTVFGGQPFKPDYNNIPCAVFSGANMILAGKEEQGFTTAEGIFIAGWSEESYG
ncbi:hypothetical protein SLEP1_g43555 [Rubroshorea leprosula]|uniref:Uncharacterized protein n=1 Tax=Rubroshorea leprosula TaxID=152421 RepID=A0AAV5LDB2_9ROSI|nr:hypothetical protein SLEP1_g43555 [Rubroshorea leprosula]